MMMTTTIGPTSTVKFLLFLNFGSWVISSGCGVGMMMTTMKSGRNVVHAFVSTPMIRQHDLRRTMVASTKTSGGGGDYCDPTINSNDNGYSNDNTSKEEEQQTYQIHWTTSKGMTTFHAYQGETLRTAALRRGVVSPHNGQSQLINCRGLGTCGTCAVYVQGIKGGKEKGESQGVNVISPPPIIPTKRNRKEEIRLSLPPDGMFGSTTKNADDSGNDDSNNDNSGSGGRGDITTGELRLACQIQVYGDLSVTKHAGFWGQDPTTLSNHEDCQTYFGDLEFLLDGNSPPSPAATQSPKSSSSDDKTTTTTTTRT